MPELFIPEKLRSVVILDHTPMWDVNYNRDAARYHFDSDTITLDPALADVAVLCEELWHRKQRRVRNRLGLPAYEGERDERVWIRFCADELGIAPRTRNVAVRLNLELGVHHRRYFYLLRIFWATCLANFKEESRDYFQALKGEKLFDGLSFVTKEFYEPRFDPSLWSLRRFEYQREFRQTDLFWGQVNEARKCW